MKIALIQQTASNDIDASINKAVSSTKEAAKNGANIICFAELAFTPFYPQQPKIDGSVEHSETIPGTTTDLFSRLAKELGIVIILNLYEKEGNNYYDSSPVIDVDGKILGTTRMIHITDYNCFHEKGYYTPGDTGAPVYNTQFGKIGVAICYDRHFPEYMRALAISGAEIVFIPQAGSLGEWPEGLYEAEMRVTAFQNGYYTALCNRVGKEERLTFAGESFVCDPGGNVVSRASAGKDEILYCDIDIKRVNDSHARKLFLADRRAELYGEWLNE